MMNGLIAGQWGTTSGRDVGDGYATCSDTDYVRAVGRWSTPPHCEP